MAIKFNGKTATVEWGGIKLRGTVKTLDLGLLKRTDGDPNGDGTIDFAEVPGKGMLEFESAVVADVEFATLQTLVDEPMLVTCAGRKIQFDRMTWTEGGSIGEEGTSTIKAVGEPATRY